MWSVLKRVNSKTWSTKEKRKKKKTLSRSFSLNLSKEISEVLMIQHTVLGVLSLGVKKTISGSSNDGEDVNAHNPSNEQECQFPQEQFSPPGIESFEI